MGENEYNLRGREGEGGKGWEGGRWVWVKHVLLVSSPGNAGYSASREIKMFFSVIFVTLVIDSSPCVLLML
jgi:hypothetical protein